MGLLTKPLATVEAPGISDAIRLAEVELAFTEARLAFNTAYQAFFDYHKKFKTGPFFTPIDHHLNIEFPVESGEAKVLAIAATKARDVFYRVMAERAALLQKLGRIR